MYRLLRLYISLLILPLTVFGSGSVPLPEGLETQWGQVPVENHGGEHDVMVINGLWRFQPGDPAKDAATAQPEDQWTHMWVPGSWHTRPSWNESGIVVDGNTPLWEQFISKHREWPIGWFEREVTIPESWGEREVFIEFSEISTRAQVWLDGHWCGALEKTSGRVELTEHIRAGQVQTLLVQVLAIPPSEPILFLQGETAEQIILKPARLSNFGLIWDVQLVAEPSGPSLQDLRLKTSVSEETFSIEGALDSGDTTDTVDLFVQVEDMDGSVIRDWSEEKVHIEADGSFNWSVGWLPERLWDIDDPYLMQARIRASGEDWADERLVRFGFREFEVRGKEFYLNGSAVRMRPVPNIDMPQIAEVMEQWMRGIKEIGFNMVMVHQGHGPDILIEAADRLGIMIFAEVPEIKNYAVRDTWIENRDSWRERMGEVVSDYYNHPSIVMWWTGFNVFAHGEDQNPARIGQVDEMMIRNADWERRLKIGLEAMDMIRAEDPSRGVYSHNGSIVGDIQTTNTYLCLIPLQEREEWLSEWSVEGEMPYLACEFGTPFNNTFMQGKAGGGWTTLGAGENAKGAANSATMMTEYAAVYLGADAYRQQTREYQDMIRASHVTGFVHDNTRRVKMLDHMIRSKNFQDLQVLFGANTLRSWRTWGMTGGLNLWGFSAQAYKEISWRKNLDNMPLGPFQPGTRGKYRSEISKSLYYNFMEGGWERMPGGDATLANNHELLVWIGGDAEQCFTDKDHQFFSGDRIAKQVILINDRRHAVTFNGTWNVELGGELLAEGTLQQTLQPGTNGFVPFEADLPNVDGQVLSGRVHLSVEADGQTLTDVFEFRVYPIARPQDLSEEIAIEETVSSIPESETKRSGFFSWLWGSRDEDEVQPASRADEPSIPFESMPLADGEPVMLLEGDGTTRDWIERLGIPVEEWDARSELPLVIGRGALEGASIDFDALRDWVHEGGVLLLSSPSPEWVQNTMGFRVTPHPSRRVFPTAQPHPLNEGFSAEDLRDWNATSTTVEGYPEYSDLLSAPGDKPYHGWRWGNRGSVASFMVEKPHHSSWRPIFEGEFDLAYSPLMELAFGQGRVLISTFDLEDNVAVTPAAYELGQQLLSYMSGLHGNSPVKGHIAYAGEAKWERILNKMGAHLTEDTDQARVVVLGKRHGYSDDDIRGFLESGRNVFLLRGAETPEFSGWSWDSSSGDYYGTTEIPVWPETAALSYSDYHSRAPYPFWRIRGEGTDSEGMLARMEVGDGVLMAAAFDPTWIRADQQPFMRLTAWRHSRNLVSLISALGGGFKLDAQFFDQQPLPTGKIPLTGTWQLKWVNPVPAATRERDKYTDDGISQAARSALFGDVSAAGWVDYTVPSDADIADSNQGAVDGEFVIRRVVEIPEDWAGESLTLNLGPVDDHDTTYWNGVEIGSTGAQHPSPWAANRIYRIPGELVQMGENSISIRVMDLFGGSGINNSEMPPVLIRPGDMNLQFYHPDYRTDFAYGDDPYRYYRW